MVMLSMHDLWEIDEGIIIRKTIRLTNGVCL